MENQQLIEKCLQGDKQSLKQLIESVQKLVFNLSFRFLWNREDAEDATQEILLRLITNLSKYNGRSKFSTWTYRVAINYLINLRKTKVEEVLTSFDVYADDLKNFKAPTEYNLPDKELLEKEMKMSCTMAMLQCLNRDQRMAFILGNILKINSKVGANITETTPDNFRKRLEQARQTLSNFLNNNCGVYNPSNSCRCNKRINTALACGRIEKSKLSFANQIESYNDEMEELCSLAGIYHNHGTFKCSTDMMTDLMKIVSSKRIFSDN